MDYKNEFYLPEGVYLLNHSVGRPLKAAKAGFEQDFWQPWQDSGREPWGHWLGVVDKFRTSLARLFDGRAEDFCPQVNLSSALTKLVMSHPRLNRAGARILMSEQDFPSMGFALRQALPEAELVFVPADADITDANVWDRYLSADLDLAFISHAYSNTGALAPVAELVARCRDLGVLSLIDVAQSAGVVPLSLARLNPDFLIGSAVKWLCSGPGAAYLWVNPEQLSLCLPRDVGWFSHENPFEFDIHQFRNHPTALRFWGGTPSVAPYAIAAHAIAWFAELGSDVLRVHNQALVSMLYDGLHQYGALRIKPENRSGTAILDFGQDNEAVQQALAAAAISVDRRRYGLRVSPHLYNDVADIRAFIACVEATLA
ncbi:aminotransferase class V-fold PLP-dependent enzyme [Shewanella cyperi]|uniref:Aminotransferase class V-fold PLP-dependent enzyme n=1 Tax=Shewanella cyperi TaxID=2814292 RepID=A0A974XK63_9GAMM|nr:aminotransferase class V-fold PLP-dependent enzyme [Shewanella cyperi]QSX29901.1 aminotransferase class V-fold PLP-dependent enzyme [Shewanella cyperi]